MADEHESVTGAVEHAEAIQADAMAAATETAVVAAQAAVANAEQTAAQLAAAASEHAAELEVKAAEHAAQTEDQLQWLRDATQQTAATLENHNSALTQIAERQQKTETLLSALAEKLLTPPASEPEVPTVAPASQSAVAEGQKEAEKPKQGRARHRSI